MSLSALTASLCPRPLGWVTSGVRLGPCLPGGSRDAPVLLIPRIPPSFVLCRTSRCFLGRGGIRWLFLYQRLALGSFALSFSRRPGASFLRGWCRDRSSTWRSLATGSRLISMASEEVALLSTVWLRWSATSSLALHLVRVLMPTWQTAQIHLFSDCQTASIFFLIGSLSEGLWRLCPSGRCAVSDPI